ncbi:MAG TPA: nitrous oxide reductase accessory protein NosL [Thermoanaerobaculia bacterium]|nr:nitrous oxide reductase accessory protein NosL [Thermoanaerobaculia bacterium]
MRSPLRVVAVLSVAVLAACGGGADGPVPVDTKNDACAWCRMSVSDLRFAAQLTAPGHEPKLFDDAGCLRDWLKEPREAAEWTAWLSDHRTREWVKATDAVVVREPAIQTPMDSGLVAWANAASREQDPTGKSGSPVPIAEVIGPFAAGAK